MKSRIVQPAASFQPPETCTAHEECQAAQTSLEDLRKNALGHYERVTAVAHEWYSVIPKAINFYFDHSNENTRVPVDRVAPGVDLQRRLYEECVTANWDPERKNTFAEEIAHLHEELSEAFRAWRRYKDCEVREVNGKLEGVPIELADVLIGMCYNAELYGFDLLEAVERKHQFNLNRNYVAEGRQLHAPVAPPAPLVSDRDPDD